MDGYNLNSLADFLQKALDRYRGNGNVPHSALPKRARSIATLGEEKLSPSVPWRDTAFEAAWKDLETLWQKGEVTTAIVTGWNRGGLLVRWNDLQGFVPASQLKEVPIFESEEARDELLSRWVGEELRLKVIELDPSRNRLVFSERATLWGPGDAERLLAELKPGDIREGYVSNLCEFGAFVDLGGVDGLIHISELSWGRVIHPAKHLQLGQKVRVLVLAVDREERHVSLSLKRLLPNPWAYVEEKYAPNQMVEATVTHVVDFGIFVQLEEGLEGLVHISEIADEHVANLHQFVSPGDRVQVRILHIDAPKHRLSLSMREPPACPEDE